MSQPGLAQRMRYALGTGARVAFYAGHYLAARRLRPQKREGAPGFVPAHAMPSEAAIYADLKRLMERDWANIAAGVYAAPHDLVPDLGDLAALARASRGFFKDLPTVDRRRREEAHQEVFERVSREGYPRYYLQNFHYQTDGYLSAHSAGLYDFQVETLFSGAADAMRRQALPPIAETLKGRDQRKARLLDVACGTGRLLGFVKDNFPRLPALGVDLSPAYLDFARERLAAFSGLDFVRANAERLPFEDGEFDVATAVFLFHELPPKARAAVAREMARVTKAGGRIVLVDSVQYGDHPPYDGLLDYFPAHFHEPYYAGYAREDFSRLFGAAGARQLSAERAFLSKVMVFGKG
ncbi:MAG: class I SAM-dependent methyltransferase [Alphaproteobacteria bacterium]|nr:class I SAM-dependent methyltransferase [Alphaproteobacteria bacterium]